MGAEELAALEEQAFGWPPSLELHAPAVQYRDQRR